MDTATKVGFSLSFALFIVIVILIIFMTWTYYSVFQKDSYFFDLVGPSVCDPPCQHGSFCIPNYGCVCSPDYYGADCSKVVLPNPSNTVSTSPSDTPVLYASATCTDLVKSLENKLRDGYEVLTYFQDGVTAGKLPANTCHELNVLSNAIPDFPKYTYSDYYGESTSNEPSYPVKLTGGTESRTCAGEINAINIYKRNLSTSDYPAVAYTEFNCSNDVNSYSISNERGFPTSHQLRYENLDLETKECKGPAIGFHGHTVSDENNRITDLNLTCSDDILEKSDDPNLSQFSFTCPPDEILLGFRYRNERDWSQLQNGDTKPVPVYLSRISGICGKNPLL